MYKLGSDPDVGTRETFIGIDAQVSIIACGWLIRQREGGILIMQEPSRKYGTNSFDR